jgi:hypothetical protein
VTGKQGRTVLFVSHNMDLITKLCTRAILLNGGRVATSGPVDAIARQYMDEGNVAQLAFQAKETSRSLCYAIIDPEALLEERLVVRIGFKYPHKVAEPVFGVVVYTEGGTAVTASNTRFHPLKVEAGNLLEGEVMLEFSHLPLWSDRYSISVWVNDGWTVIDSEENALVFEFISQSAPLKTQSIKALGPVYLEAQWTVVGPLRKLNP